MITEIEARELLARAAGSIEVPTDDLVVLVPPQRPRWVAPVVAAAAIAAAVATGLVLIHDNDRNDGPGPIAPTPTPTVDPFTGRVPSVFAHDADSAQQLLEDRGLRVHRTVVTNRCSAPDRALRTKPIAGSPIQRGENVTLYVSGPLVAFCSPKDLPAWLILDFANGRGPTPSFAPEVAYYLNGKVTDQRSALASLAALTRQVQSAFGAPSLQVGTVGSPETCFNASISERYRSQEALWIYLSFPSPSIFECPSAQVYFDDQHNVDAIVVVAPPEVTHPPEPITNVDFDGVGASFARFSRGGPRPTFAPRIQLLYGQDQVRTLTAARAADRTSWWVCASGSVSNCPLLTDIAAHSSPPGSDLARQYRRECRLPERRGGQAEWWSVVVWANDGLCDGVRVFYDVRLRITAVGLVQGPG